MIPLEKSRSPVMRHLFLLLALVSTLIVASTSSADQVRATRSSVGAQRKGPVAKLVELERRKNEWLRQTFTNNK